MSGGRTWGDLARSIAAVYRLAPTDEEINFALWERTAWPIAGVEYVSGQLHEWFASVAEGDPLGDDPNG